MKNERIPDDLVFAQIPCAVTWKTTGTPPHDYHRCKRFILKYPTGVLKGHATHECKCGAKK